MSDLQDGITVTGVGEAVGVPDVVRLALASEVRAATVQEALDGAAAALDRMRTALLGQGVALRDLATRDVRLQPDWTANGHPSGYVASLGLHVVLRDLDAAGRVLSSAVAAGGDASRVHGFGSAPEDPAPLLREAREAAVVDARERAEHYAALTGRSLGAVLGIEEVPAGGGSHPSGRVSTMLAASTMPVDPGSATVAVAVDVRWELV